MAEPKNVVQAIARVMGELPAIGKDSTASSQQGGYAYRGIEAITSEAQALFAKYGVVFVPRVVSNRTENITVNGKPWTDTFLEVEYDVYGPGGTVELGGMQVIDMITVGPLLAIGRDNSDKGANKAMTQAFKYALLQVLCISDKKDDGDQVSHATDDRPVDLNREAFEALGMLIDEHGPNEAAQLKLYLREQFGAPSKMTPSQIEAATNVAAGWPATREAA